MVRDKRLTFDKIFKICKSKYILKSPYWFKRVGGVKWVVTKEFDLYIKRCIFDGGGK